MNYDKYIFSTREWIQYGLEYLIICAAVAYLFYDSLLAFVILIPFSFLYFRIRRQKNKEKRIIELKNQFIQMISCMATSLRAGFSIENSLIEAAKDVERMFGCDSVMAKELQNMIVQINLGIRIEELMSDFSDRTGVEEIKDFATVFSIAKRSGGKFSEIIERCSLMMVANRETENQIEILISGKKYEQRVLSVIPFALIAALRYTSSDFISVLYHNLFGAALMSICILIYLLSLYLSEKISNIKC